MKCDNCMMCIEDSNFKKIGDRCNFCLEGKNRLASFIKKKTNKSIPFEMSSDILLGLSGGVDSTYLVHSFYKKGLRPEVLHVDLGWNSAVANRNIELLCEHYKIDLSVLVIDWETYRDSMCAFIKNDIVDIELLYDNLVFSSMYIHAAKLNKNLILSGFNSNTECVAKPKNWGSYKYDKLFIHNILNNEKIEYKKKLKFISTLDKIYYRYFRGIRWENSALDYLNYDREAAIIEMNNDFGYINYGQKHTENYFTNFYQNVILPKKFGIEKIRVHLSSEIVSQSILKQDAEIKLEEWRQKNKKINHEILTLVCDKLKIPKSRMLQYLQTPPKSKFYLSEKIINDILLKIFRIRKMIFK